MDVGALRELKDVGSDGGGGAVDDERHGCSGGRPRLREVQAVGGVESDSGRHGGEWDGSTLCSSCRQC